MKKVLILTALVSAAALLSWHRWRAQRAPSAEQFVSGIPKLAPDMRLVVATLDFTKSVAAESPKELWGFDLGTTKVAVSVPARVHYALDLSAERAVEFRTHGKYGPLTAVFPDPQVQAVEIFFGAEQTVVQAGWGRFEVFSGQNLLNQLDRTLYDAVKSEASSERVIAQIKEQARPMLAALLDTYLKEAGSRRKVVVRFRSDEGGGALALNYPPRGG